MEGTQSLQFCPILWAQFASGKPKILLKVKVSEKLHLSEHQCGFRKNHNAQYSPLNMIETWKKHLDKGEKIGVILMDLSKAFDTINHSLLLAKLDAYIFSRTSLKLM